MQEVTIDSSFPESSKLLAKVEELSHCPVWIIINTLLRGLRAKNIADHRQMSKFLICHVPNQKTFFCSKTGSDEIICRKAVQPIMEEVEFYPLLVESKSLKMKSSSKMSA
jgi:hypothetical protein